MLKTAIAGIIGCALLLLLSAPGYTMLRLLEPELSGELQLIAREHVALSHNVDVGTVIVESTWLREFWNIKVDVYMVEALSSTASGQTMKVTVPIRVDQKLVLSPAELIALEEEDGRIASTEPQARILTTAQPGDTPTQPGDAAVLPGNAAALPETAIPPAENTAYYLAVGVILAILAVSLLIILRKAKARPKH